MLSVNCPKPDAVIKAFDKQVYEGISFEVVSQMGLSVLLRCSGNDQTAKAVAKKILKDLPELRYRVANVSVVDDKGRII